MPASLSITFGGEELELRADRTLFWPARQILFAADLHAGKAEHMRAYGLNVPAGNLEADLVRLNQALTKTGATRLIFLGDLFHSEPNNEWRTFADWCHRQSAAIQLVKGNHDRFLTPDMFAAAGLTVHDEPYDCTPFSLRHHPAEQNEDDRPVLAGHIHPVAWVQGTAKDRLRLPCFWRQANQLILPAYGSLTGGYAVNRSADAELYVCSTDHSVIITIAKPGQKH